MTSSRKEYFEPISEPMISPKSATYWSIFCWLELGGFVLATPVVLAAAWPIPWDIFCAYGIAGFWVTILAMIFAATQTDYLKRKNKGRVEFDGEDITIYNKSGVPLFTAPLTQCRWFSGNRSWASVPYDGDARLTACGFGKIFLIEFPNEFRTPERYVGKNMTYAEGPVIAAVGLTEETRRYWEDVFYRLGIERNEERELQKSPYSATFFLLLWILMLPGSFFLTMFLAGWIDSLLLSQGTPRDLALGIAYPLFVPGTVYLILFLYHYPMLTRRNMEIRRFKHPVGYRLGIWYSYILLAVISLALFGITLFDKTKKDPERDLTPRAVMAAAVMVVAMTVLSGAAIASFRAQSVSE